ncbi:MAG: copper-binding protein [Betaproteobacteria bacterium]
MQIGLVVARGCFAALALLMASLATAMAQTGKLPDPADPDAISPATKYESAFSDYQPFREQTRNSWKQVNKEVADGPGMGSMSGMPSDSLPDMDSNTGVEMAKAETQTSPAQPEKARTTAISGVGVVQDIDKANGKVKLAHDPIAALGWPKMTMFFRLKDSALADQVKIGDKVEFFLEKSASGYVISDFQKGVARQDMKKKK